MQINPKEAQAQAALFEWAVYARAKYPELLLMFHIPNGGSRNVIEARNLKAQGVRAGVPDICLPVPRGKYHGLFIELKRKRGGRVSEEQQGWIAALNRVGYLAVVCYGFDDAVRTIKGYLEVE